MDIASSNNTQQALGSGRKAVCLARCALATVLALTADGCTVVNIRDDSGNSVVRRELGVLEVRLVPSCGTADASIKSLGLTVTNGGTTLGWVAGRQLVMHQADCSKPH
jgi:hypothetical protein